MKQVLGLRLLIDPVFLGGLQQAVGADNIRVDKGIGALLSICRHGSPPRSEPGYRSRVCAEATRPALDHRSSRARTSNQSCPNRSARLFLLPA